MKRQWPYNRMLIAWSLKVFSWISVLQVLLIPGAWAYSRWAGAGDVRAQLDIFWALFPILKWVNIISLGIVVVLLLLLIFVWVVRREKTDEPKQED